MSSFQATSTAGLLNFTKSYRGQVTTLNLSVHGFLGSVERLERVPSAYCFPCHLLPHQAPAPAPNAPSLPSPIPGWELGAEVASLQPSLPRPPAHQSVSTSPQNHSPSEALATRGHFAEVAPVLHHHLPDVCQNPGAAARGIVAGPAEKGAPSQQDKSR